MSGDGRKKDDAKCDEDKSQKRKLDVDAEKVKSANDWEHVDLGDDSRKNKFLRLMGASKKEHHGKIVIGEKTPSHGRSKEETEKLSEDLEEQYKQGLEMKLSGHAKKHAGLGFQDDDDDYYHHHHNRSSNKDRKDDDKNNNGGKNDDNVVDDNDDDDVRNKRKNRDDCNRARKDSTRLKGSSKNDDEEEEEEEEDGGKGEKRRTSERTEEGGKSSKEKKFGVFVKASDS